MKKLLPLFLLTILLQSCYSGRVCPTYTGGEYLEKNKKTTERKIIYNASVHLNVEDVDTATKQFKFIAEQFEGYVQETGNYRSMIRVKSEHLDAALDVIASLGKVTSKMIDGNDVTEQYIDYEIKLENAEKSSQRYLELLDKATSVTDILNIERELERLNQEINLLKGKINKLSHLSDYATITIYTTKKVKPGILGYVGMGLWYPVKWLFVRN